jgi:DNA repair exonuclease SbcCD ATPase subunit
VADPKSKSPLDTLWASAAAIAGMYPLFGMLYGKEDDLTRQVEAAVKDMESAKRQISHWEILMRGNMEIVRTTTDEAMRVNARTTTEMLRYCIAEEERLIADRESFVKGLEPEIKKRKERREENEKLSRERDDMRYEEFHALEERVRNAEKLRNEALDAREKLVAENADLCVRVENQSAAIKADNEKITYLESAVARLRAEKTDLQGIIEARDVLNVRPVVSEFAQAMEEVLRDNDHKGGWSSCTKEYLLTRLGDEMRELKKATLDTNMVGHSAKNITKEAADVANIAMMISDVYGDHRKVKP